GSDRRESGCAICGRCAENHSAEGRESRASPHRGERVVDRQGAAARRTAVRGGPNGSPLGLRGMCGESAGCPLPRFRIRKRTKWNALGRLGENLSQRRRAKGFLNHRQGVIDSPMKRTQMYAAGCQPQWAKANAANRLYGIDDLQDREV